MGYIAKNLLSDEKILYQTKKSLIIFLTPAILAGLCLMFFLNDNPYIFKMGLLIALAALLNTLSVLLEYVFSEFAVTNKRILMKEGFFFRHTNDTRLTTIASVSVNQSLLGQILNYGTVVINSFGGSGDPFSQIDNPVAFQKCLQEQLLGNK